MRHFARLQDLQALLGQELRHSDRVTIDQSRIDLFAQPNAASR